MIRIDKNMKNIRREGNRLTAAAGAMLGAVAGFAAENGLTGLEFASGIPGTVGGAVTMNAGAYGGEMKDVVVRVDGILPDGTEMNLIVTEVTMELAEGDPAAIRAKMSELNRQRAEKQPLDVPSAGSTFKRPEGFYAAALIDQCGLKGYSVGGAQVSMKHAGFLVNSGDSSRDYLELVRTVQRIVRERAGVELEPEIRIRGEEAK